MITDLGTLGGKESSAVAINERGQVVGRSERRGATRSATPSCGRTGRCAISAVSTGSSWASDINDRGQVVGASVSRTKNREGNRIEHAVLWQSGKMLDLTPTAKLAPLDCYGDGSRGSCDASGMLINGRGQVVVSMTSNRVGKPAHRSRLPVAEREAGGAPTLGAPSWSWRQQRDRRDQRPRAGCRHRRDGSHAARRRRRIPRACVPVAEREDDRPRHAPSASSRARRRRSTSAARSPGGARTRFGKDGSARTVSCGRRGRSPISAWPEVSASRADQRPRPDRRRHETSSGDDDVPSCGRTAT